MRVHSSTSWRAHRTLASVLGAAMVLAGLGWSGGAAWASTRSPAATHHGTSGLAGRHRHHATHKKHHGPKVPVVGNAKDLNVEPVVHAAKGRAPKKLEVKNLVVGTGATATMASTVSVVYVGALYKTGKDFTQSTWTTRKPTTFPLTGVVAGFADGLVGMKVGGRREIVIPPKLAYGNRRYGPIPANSTLVFVVDLKAVSG